MEIHKCEDYFKQNSAKKYCSIVGENNEWHIVSMVSDSKFTTIIRFCPYCGLKLGDD